MARKTKDEAERTRERILASALALFVKNGYENTTLTDVAARLKMTKGAVYWHFSSKEKLLVAIVDEMLNRFASELEAKMPRHEMSFHSVADAMVENAKMIAKSPSAYLFMKTQVRWGSATMRGVREDLLTNRRFGPFNAFVQAIENDMRKGAIREWSPRWPQASVWPCGTGWFRRSWTNFWSPTSRPCFAAGSSRFGFQ